MDDLNGLDWSSSPRSMASAAPNTPSTSSYSQFRSFPTLSPQSTNSPSRPGSTKPLDLRSASPALSSNDSFSNLVSFGAKKNGTGASGKLSLLEQQKRLQEERAKQEEEKRKLFDKQFGGIDSLGLKSNGTGSSIGSPLSRSMRNDSDDLLAAFSADAKVDKSSYYPPPSRSTANSGQATPLSRTSTPPTQSQLSLDPFDVSNLPSRTASPFATTAPMNMDTQNDEDDVLGLLGKPVSALPPRLTPTTSETSSPAQQNRSSKPSSRAKTPPPGKDPRDPAIAELVDMGFPVEDAKRALAETDTGLDVRAAIDFLLHQAHSKTNSRKQPHSRRVAGEDDIREDDRRQERRNPRERHIDKLAWKEEPNEKPDITAFATEIGGNLLKSAGSLWATSRKRVVKVVNEFQQPEASSDGMPKWMRDAQREQENGERPKTSNDIMTDEAQMLEMGARKKERERKERMRDHDASAARQREFDARERERRREAERIAEMNSREANSRRKAKLSREAVESESAQAYVSPARRRGTKPAPAPVAVTPPVRVAEGDLLFGSESIPKVSSAPPAVQNRRAPTQSTSNNPFTPRSSQPQTRQIPHVSPSALSSSQRSRTAGTESFKRGDYPQALIHYTTALSPLPSTHPTRYIVLSNRALVQIKLGDSKAAIIDCDDVIQGIGSTKGEGEVVDTGDGTTKELKDFWGKAVVRRAEALEHLEKWSDAAKAWSHALETGVGGATASAGKARCEKALAPKPPPRAASAPVKRPTPARAASSTAQTNIAAVSRLRAANAAADAADSEKFALHDTVEAKITSWRGGKENNLRALLSSLDNVLWEGSGWKKVGLHELVIPSKVKIAYMKGIGKVHPDKVPATATTEQKMLSAAVFSTLNEAWDDFKKQNNL